MSSKKKRQRNNLTSHVSQSCVIQVNMVFVFHISKNLLFKLYKFSLQQFSWQPRSHSSCWTLSLGQVGIGEGSYWILAYLPVAATYKLPLIQWGLKDFIIKHCFFPCRVLSVVPNGKREVHRFWMDLIINMCCLKSPCKQLQNPQMHWQLCVTTCCRPRGLKTAERESMALKMLP